MAYRIEPNQSTGEAEIVIDGFQEGISDSPHFGLANMQNINNDSIAGVAMCNYKLKQVSQTPISAVSFTADPTGDTITFTGTALQKGAAVKFTGASLPGGITTGTVYYALTTGNTVQITASYTPYDGLGGVLDITTTGSGAMTFSTVDMGTPMDYTTYYFDTTPSYFIIDSNGRTWCIISNASVYTNIPLPVLLANETKVGASAYANGNGICAFKGFLFVFRNAAIDAYALVTSGTWTNDWKAMVTTTAQNYTHKALWGQDDKMYYTDSYYLGSVSLSGAQTNIANYSQTQKALTLPSNEISSYIEESSIGVSTGSPIYVGTLTSNFIYPWDRTSTSYNVPLVVPEVGCYRMLNINRLVYIFAGKRGNIYYTNGASISHFAAVPKYPTSSPYPIITWGGRMALNNNLCFGAADANNNASGCYAITLAVGTMLNTIAGAIRYKGQPSAGKYNTTILIPFTDGIQYYAGWFNGTYGGIDILDSATPTFYSNYESNIESDIIPIGTALQPKTFNTIEFKLDTPLVNGEKVRISMRSELHASYTQALETIATASLLPVDGSSSSIPIQLGKWVQVKAELQSLANGSFTRLKEIRLR